MEVIYFLVPLSLLFLGVGIWFFFWAVKHAQFDDLDGPSQRILHDDRQLRRDTVPAPKTEEKNHAR